VDATDHQGGNVKTLTLKQLADRLDAMAEHDRRSLHGGADSPVLEWAARGLRQADAEHAKQHRRAELALREVATLRTRLAELQSELTQARSDIRALEAIAARPAPLSTEQAIETDSRGNIKRITTRPLDDRRPVGFS
jgi:hypothetical protein